MEAEVIAINMGEEEAIKHQIAKLVLGTAAGFLAGKMAERLYNAALEAYRARQEITPE